MDVIILNGMQFSIEFIKVLLVVVNCLNIRVTKKINNIFSVFLIVIMAVSIRIDLTQISMIYALFCCIIFMICLKEKVNIGYVIVTYIGISVVDMLIGNLYIYYTHMSMEQMREHKLLILGMNCISLIIILIYTIFSNKRKTIRYYGKTYIVIMFLGGGLLAVYLTFTQFVGMKEITLNYEKNMIYSAFFITGVYFLGCYTFIKLYEKNTFLKYENQLQQGLLKTQSDYYTKLLKKEEDTRRFRHDIRQHLVCLQHMCEEEMYSEISAYIRQLDQSIKELSPTMSVGNSYINLILSDLSEQFPEVKIIWKGKIPELNLSTIDLCTLFYNLLKNAFEAAERLEKKEVYVMVKVQGNNVVIEQWNLYRLLRTDEDGNFVSTKPEKGHGYGLGNIKECVDKYNGNYNVSVENNMFYTEIILPNIF